MFGLVKARLILPINEPSRETWHCLAHSPPPPLSFAHEGHKSNILFDYISCVCVPYSDGMRAYASAGYSEDFIL